MYRVLKMSSKSIKTINNYFLANLAFLVSNVCISESISFSLLIPISILEWAHCKASFDKFFSEFFITFFYSCFGYINTLFLPLFLLTFFVGIVKYLLSCFFFFFDLRFSLLVLHFLFCFQIQLVFCISTFH